MTELKSNFNVVEKEAFQNKVSELVRRYKVEVSMVWAPEARINKTIDSEGLEIKYKSFPVEVTFSFGEFKIEGYEYLGCIKDEEMMGFTTIHGNDKLEGHDIQEWVDSFNGIPCSACNRKHSRKIGHLFLETETNEVKVFGSGCAKKYFGINFDRILGFYENFDSRYNEWEDEFIRSFFSNHYTLDRVIKAVYWSIHHNGYMSNSAAKEGYNVESTADDVRGMLIEKVYPKDMEDVVKDINVDDILDVHYDGDTDFAYNMNTVIEKMSQGLVSIKDLGYISYMVYDKWFKAEPKNIEWVLPNVEVKERLRNIEVTLVECRRFESSWGEMVINVFHDEENNVRYKWISQTSVSGKLNVKCPVKINLKGATVKELQNHVTYGKSVMINRVIAEEV